MAAQLHALLQQLTAPVMPRSPPMPIGAGAATYRGGADGEGEEEGEGGARPWAPAEGEEDEPQLDAHGAAGWAEGRDLEMQGRLAGPGSGGGGSGGGGSGGGGGPPPIAPHRTALFGAPPTSAASAFADWTPPKVRYIRIPDVDSF